MSPNNRMDSASLKRWSEEYLEQVHARVAKEQCKENVSGLQTGLDDLLEEVQGMQEVLEDVMLQMEALQALGGFSAFLKENGSKIEWIGWGEQPFEEGQVPWDENTGIEIGFKFPVESAQKKSLCTAVYMRFFHVESSLLEGLRYEEKQGFDRFAQDFLKRVSPQGGWEWRWEALKLEKAVAPKKARAGGKSL